MKQSPDIKQIVQPNRLHSVSNDRFSHFIN